jgi:hypothetical protein
MATPDDPDHIDRKRLQHDLDRLSGAGRQAQRADEETTTAVERVLAHADTIVAHIDRLPDHRRYSHTG